MTPPLLRAQLENDDSYDDPSEDTLFECWATSKQRLPLVIVERRDDTTGQTYTHALRDEDCTYIVERRLGTEQSHESPP